MARTFVAVWPPPAVLDTLLALPRPDHPDVRWLPRTVLHATLRFLGDVAPATVTHRLLTTDLRRSHAVVGPATSVLGSRALMAPVTGLGPLATAVATATSDLGQPPPARPFVGHVTLARTGGEAVARRVAGTPVAAAFDVDEIAVATSETHPDGARYTPTARIPLG